MYKEIFIATSNPGKVAEFASFFQAKNLQVKSLLDLPEKIDIVEDGKTFEENARKKAETIGENIGMLVLADDSGLEVDALNGEPGIYSARYAGPSKQDSLNNEKLLKEMASVKEPNRTARFVCALAIYFPNKEIKVVRGHCEGVIGRELIGDNGFGYDPLFYIPSLNKTMAQLAKHEKNKLSHRANALEKLANQWSAWSDQNGSIER